MTILHLYTRNLVLIFSLYILCGSAPVKPGSEIIGQWYTGNKEAIVEVFEKNGMYHGKVIFLSQPLDRHGHPKKDRKNKDPRLRERSQLGLMVLYDLRFNTEKHRWEGGKVYVPSLGREADAVLYLEGRNTLKVRGFVKNEQMGQTQVWTRKD